MARARKPSKPKPRVVSRPAVLPAVKDSSTRTLIAGIDALGEQLRRASAENSTWKIIKGGANTKWVAHLKQRGEWDWDGFHAAMMRIEGLKTVYKDISDRRVAFCRLHFVQYNEDGDQVMEGWYSPSPMTVWANLVKILQTDSNGDETDSHARKYEWTVLDTIVFSFASRAP